VAVQSGKKNSGIVRLDYFPAATATVDRPPVIAIVFCRRKDNNTRATVLRIPADQLFATVFCMGAGV